MRFNQSNFIDIHTHILPGIDDGPQHIEESLLMARSFVQAGVTKIVATPHFLPGTAWSPKKEEVVTAVETFTERLTKEGIELTVLAGMEIGFHSKLEENLHRESLLSLGDSGYYLIEPSFYGEQETLLSCLFRLLEGGHKLVLAHPERIDGLRGKLDVLGELVSRGLYLQINAGSLLGYMGMKSKENSEKLLDLNFIDLIASDAHDSSKRPPLKTGDIEKLSASPWGDKLITKCYRAVSEIFRFTQ